MPGPVDNIFIQHINQNLGIAHKVSRVYFQDGDDREDVLQEMMYQLWRSYPCFDGHSKFSTWMYKVALNTAITYAKINGRELGKERLPADYNQLTENSEQNNVNEKLTFLYGAINALSGMDKAIILLYLEDNSYDEISTITGLTKSNVSVRLVRIKKNLKEQLKNII